LAAFTINIAESNFWHGPTAWKHADRQRSRRGKRGSRFARRLSVCLTTPAQVDFWCRQESAAMSETK
jgi:hypothetical protein